MMKYKDYYFMELFFELLQVSLGTRGKMSRIPNARDWAALYNEAELQAIVGVLLDGLERLPDDQLPPLEVKLQWIGMVQVMEAKYRLHSERVAELVTQFRGAGFQTCLLKGVGNAKYYPNSSRRQCGDIDLWVCGSRKDITAFVRSFDKEAKPKFKDIAFPYKETEVEAHFIPTYLNNFRCNKRLQRYIDDNRQRQFENCVEVGEGLRISTPTDDFNVIYQIAHLHHHFFCEGIGMRHFVDYFYLLKREDVRCKREELRCKLGEFGMLKFARGVMWVLHEKLGLDSGYLIAEPDEKVGKMILKQILEYGNFGNKELEGKSGQQARMSSAIRPLKYLWKFPGASIDRLVFMGWLQGWKCFHSIN